MLSTLKILSAENSTDSSFKKPPREIVEKKGLGNFFRCRKKSYYDYHSTSAVLGKAKPMGGYLSYDQSFPKRSSLSGTFSKLSFFCA